MNLENVAVNIRPRTPWEAIDLGFLLARHWYKRLWSLWMLTACPGLAAAIVVGLILPGSSTRWALFLFWFFKPFYEPCVLTWAARALFDEQCTTKETIRDVRKAISLQWILTVLLSRISPFRSFSLPVVQLERLEGKKKKRRLALLQDASEIAVLLTVSGFLLEIFLSLSFLITLFLLIPDELHWINFGHFVFLPDKWLLLACYLFSCSIIAPLYVCSGFMMYISRRVQLEAWDIEIGFKRLRQRLEKRKNGLVRALVPLLIALSFISAPGIAGADGPDPQTAKAAITKVLQQKDFGQKVTVYRWVPKKKEAPKTQSAWAQFWIQLFEFLAKISKFITPIVARYGEFLLWCCVGGIIGLFLLKYSKLRLWLDRKFPTAGAVYQAPEIMFGLDLRPESLPERIESVCLQLLDQGKKREAMSLLYRGTLSALVNRCRLEIHPSFTENECCREVGRNRPETESAFFDDLTSLWVFLAFGHRDPEIQACRNLVGRWETLYGGPS
jgi:Domain of unknown function (DUF4129)